MKKTFILVLILMCFGCGKSETTIINIYEKDSDENIVEDNNIETDDQTKVNSDTADLSDKAKDWYAENKDDIKDDVKHLYESAKEKAIKLKDKAKDWYAENKDDIKDNLKDLYDNAKEKKDELKDKYYEWYYNNLVDDE